MSRFSEKLTKLSNFQLAMEAATVIEQALAQGMNAKGVTAFELSVSEFRNRLFDLQEEVMFRRKSLTVLQESR